MTLSCNTRQPTNGPRRLMGLEFALEVPFLISFTVAEHTNRRSSLNPAPSLCNHAHTLSQTRPLRANQIIRAAT